MKDAPEPHVLATYDQVMAQARDAFPDHSPAWHEAWLRTYYAVLDAEDALRALQGQED